MSRKADVTFCKVAITAGLVSQEQAQKALALVDKREQETGRRPLIGAVFTKYQLLTQEEVQRVNEAVAKRLGGTHPVVARTAAGAKGAAKRRKPKRKPIDPKLLKQGIGFGILFLVVLIGIAIAYWMPEDESETEAMGAPGATMAGGEGTSGAGGGRSAAAATPPRPTEELPREISGRFMMVLGDIRRDVDDNPPRARKLLAKTLKDLAEFEARYIIPTDLVDLRKDVEAAVKGAADLEDPREGEEASGEAEETQETPAEEPAAAADDTGAASGDDDDDGGAAGGLEGLDDIDLDDI